MPAQNTIQNEDLQELFFSENNDMTKKIRAEL